MAEIRLGAIRIGFEYRIEIDFPAGFLAPEESVRMKLRRYLEDPAPLAFTPDKIADQTVSLLLTAAQTATMTPGTYIGEAVVYQPANPASAEIPLTNNRYLADCDYSPSE